MVIESYATFPIWLSDDTSLIQTSDLKGLKLIYIHFKSKCKIDITWFPFDDQLLFAWIWQQQKTFKWKAHHINVVIHDVFSSRRARSTSPGFPLTTSSVTSSLDPGLTRAGRLWARLTNTASKTLFFFAFLNPMNIISFKYMFVFLSNIPNLKICKFDFL